MVLFNYATKEITAKVVYYGPGLCGKTTNLQFIYDSLPSNNKSKMLSLATKTDRTLFFDFLPLDLGKIRGMRTKLQLYTVPGQVYYNSTRQLVLKGADGVVFVADSQDFAVDANLESLQNLEDNLRRQGVRIAEIPLVIQYNKRDLPNALSVDELNKAINRLNVPTFSSVATTGIGVEQTLRGVTGIVLQHLVRKYGLEGSEPLDKEIELLNPQLPSEAMADSVWADESTAPPAAAAAPPAAVVVDEEDEDVPLVATELVGGPAPIPLSAPPENPFGEFLERFEAPPEPPQVQQPAAFPSSAPPEPTRAPAFEPMEVPLASVEIPIPEGILRSLPNLDQQKADAERRTSDGLVREVTLPLNLSLEEIRKHKKLKIKLTLDVNILP